MKPSARQTILFAGTCVLTASVWMFAWPAGKPRPAVTTGQAPSPRESAWDGRQLKPSIEALDSAEGNEARLKAAARLEEIPVSGFPAVFDEVEQIKDHQLTLAAKVLLIRWASLDGEAAANWAWKRFRAEGLWDEALKEIGPSWAWHHPAGLGEWALKLGKNRKPGKDNMGIAEALANDTPALDFDMLGRISTALMAQDPRMAYKVLLCRGGWSSHDGHFADALSTAAQAREALLAFDGLEKMEVNVTRDNEFLAKAILARWQELDPEDLSRSPYARFVLADRFNVAGNAEAAREVVAVPEGGRVAAANRVIDGITGFKRANRVLLIATDWVAVDPDGCMQWVESLPPELEETKMLLRVQVMAPHDLNKALLHGGKLKPEQRQAHLVNVFDSWAKAHPDEKPDSTSWSPARKQAWMDLEAIRPDAGEGE